MVIFNFTSCYVGFQGTDATMLNKINSHHSRSKIYIPPRSVHDTVFGITHFAGVVYYQSKGELVESSLSLHAPVHQFKDNFFFSNPAAQCHHGDDWL